jgi:DNA polymerase-3 subunit delta'
MVEGTAGDPTQVAAGVTRIHAAMEAFERNPNEALMLQELLWSLPVLTSGPHR